MTDEETLRESKAYPIRGDLHSAATREANEMFKRDQQRQREVDEANARVLAAFPDAPHELGRLLRQNRWLGSWLTQFAAKESGR